MKRKAMGTAIALLLLTALGAGQTQEQYLDVYIAQVKPEKRADFDAITKRMVAANRQSKGDTWLTMETAYGPGNRVSFISTRQGYADAEKGSDAFYGSLQKAFGKAGTGKIMQDFSQCVLSTRSELRRRRWDLSSNAPTDPAAMAKLLGDARYLRTNTVHVRPGQVAAFEALLKEVKTANEKASPPQTRLVSQAVAGQEGTVFYITTLQNSLAGFDTVPTIQQVLGDEGYQRFLKTNTEVVAGTELVINRFLPELSNAPEAVAAIAPDFWQPRAAVTAKAPKAKSAVVNASAASKVEEKK
jgi:hypothetical protein